MASDARQPDPRVAAQRKALIHVANWQIMDERHRKLAQIDDSVTFLRRICDNVRSQPDEPKFRKIKLTNPTFTRHVRDAPGGEAFLKEAGWHVKVEDFEKFWVYDARPGSVEWQILEEACKELDKLVQLVTDKKRRAAGDNKAETQRRLESVRAALEEDKHERALRFQAAASAGAADSSTAVPGAVPRPGSPRQRQQGGSPRPGSPRSAG